MSRTICCSDIHGNFKALKQCLERSRFDYEKDTLLVLGDLVDGHKETKQCFDEILKIKNLIYILGNHDYMAYRWMVLGRDFKSVRDDLKLLEKFGFIEFSASRTGKRPSLTPKLIVDQVKIVLNI